MKALWINLNWRHWLWPIVAAVALIAGTGLRFADLGRKMVWLDEVSTFQTVSGIGRTESLQYWLARRQFPATEMPGWERLNLDRGFPAVLAAVRSWGPQITPLYFVLARFWAKWVTNQAVGLRLLSVWLSLLSLPAMFWLGRELFGSVRAGWLAMVLVAVSPFHLLYAQEARMYSLWMTLTVVSTAAFVWACRTNQVGRWALYAVTVALGMYTHLLFGLVLAAQVGCAWGVVRWRWFGGALLAGLLAFAPWFLTAWPGRQSEGMALGVRQMQPGRYVLQVGAQATLPFWDMNTDPEEPGAIEIAWRLVLLTVVGIAVWELRQADRLTCRLVWGLIGLGPVLLVALDVRHGSEMALMHRYLLPSLLGVQLAVAGWLARRWEWLPARLIAVVLVATGLVSAGTAAHASEWWTKGHNVTDPLLGRVVTASPRPLLVFDLAGGSASGMLAVGPWLGSNVTVRAQFRKPWPATRDGFTDVFIYRPGLSRRDELRERGYERVSPALTDRLWRLEPK